MTNPIAYILETGITYAGTTPNACLLGYPLDGGGSAVPSVSINLPDPANSYISLATDPAGNLYLGLNGSPTGADGEVQVFAAGATGLKSPTRTLTVPATSTAPGTPVAIAVDGAGDIYVALNTNVTFGSAPIYEFAPGASTPIRTISVANVGGWGCQKLAVDAQGNVYCAINELGIIQIFSSTQSGSVIPARTISIKNSGVMLNEFTDFCLDPSGNVYVAAVVELNAGLPATILEYPGDVTQTGDEAPAATISGGNLPGNTQVNRIGFDHAGNLYVAEFNIGTTNAPLVVKFAATSVGFATPTIESWTSFPIYYDPGVVGFSVH